MRVDGWENLLYDYLHESALKKFKYGMFDCAVFASDWVYLITGIDPIKEGRGRYKDLRNGALLIKHFRGSYENIMGHYFQEHKKPSFAQRGDIVLRNMDGVPAFGIIGSNGRAYFKSEDGLFDYSAKDCVKAWRVG